jgi:hypothetical protein
MKKQTYHQLRFIWQGTKSRSVFLIIFFSAILCQPSQFNNAGDFDSHEFTETQILTCLLKGASCFRGGDNGSALTLSYTGSPFTFTQNRPIATITPTGTEVISSCQATPALPTGLAIDATNCAISGTPTATQVAMNHVITATNAERSGQVTISIAVPVLIPALVQYDFTNGSLVNSGSMVISLSSPEWAPVVTLGKDGDTNGAYLYTTNNQYFTTGDAGLPMGANPRTMCAWINPSSLPANGFHHMAIRYGNTSAANVSVLAISTSAGNKISFIGSSYDALADYTVPINTWSHLCATYNGGTTASLYVNGIFIASPSFVGSGPLNTISSSLAIGTWTGSGGTAYYWRGSLDDVSIYGIALSADQISRIFKTGVTY